MLTRRRFLKVSTATTGLGLGIGFYTWRWEPHWVEWSKRTLPIASLPPTLAGKRLVQLSDLHIGPRVDDRYLIQVFNRGIGHLVPVRFNVRPEVTVFRLERA